MNKDSTEQQGLIQTINLISTENMKHQL